MKERDDRYYENRQKIGRECLNGLAFTQRVSATPGRTQNRVRKMLKRIGYRENAGTEVYPS